ncbi:MAG: hypothetical protein ACLUNV_06675 [Sutterella wadsworthensis]
MRLHPPLPGVFAGDAVPGLPHAYLGIAALVLAHPGGFFWLKILGTPRTSPGSAGKAVHATFFAKKAERPKANPEVVVKKSRSLVEVCRSSRLRLSLTNPKSTSLLRLQLSSCGSSVRLSTIRRLSYTILALIPECFSMAWMTLLITARRRPSRALRPSSVRREARQHRHGQHVPALCIEARARRLTLRRDKHQQDGLQSECGMQAVLFCLSQNFEDVYRAEAVVICNSRGDC